MARARQGSFYADRLRPLPAQVEPAVLSELPFTTRHDLVADQREMPPFGRCHVVTIEESALIGRTGVGFSMSQQRLNLLLTSEDIRHQAELFARALFEAGVRPGHRVYVADDPRYNALAICAMHGVSVLDGIMVYAGAERSARTVRYVIPALPPDHIFLTPTYAQFFSKVLAERSGTRWPIQSLTGWGEPGYSAPHVRERLLQRWGVVSEYSPLSIVDVYGLSETGLIAMGCRSGRGLHVFEDACLVELVKPDGDRVVGTDEIGEIVITRLGSPSLPLVRYRTGDAGTLDRSPCPCGRTAPRLNRIQRLADRLIIGQRALFPLDVDEALIRASAYAEAVVIERSSERLHLQLSGIDGPLDQVHLTRVLSEDLNVPVSVEIKSSENLSSFFHKTIRVVDDGNRDVYRAELEFQRELEHA